MIVSQIKQIKFQLITERRLLMKKMHVYFSMDNGAGATESNEGNLGADDAYGFDESDNDDDSRD